MAKKAKGKASNGFWRIFMTLAGVILILLGTSRFALFFLGEKVSANVETRRFGGADDNYKPNMRYEWSVDFTFRDSDGVLRSGHTTRRGGDMGVSVEKTVYYLKVAPYINSLSSEVEPNLGQFIMIGLGVLIILVMNKKPKKRAQAHRVTARSNGEPDVPDLADYDDSVEEAFHTDSRRAN